MEAVPPVAGIQDDNRNAIFTKVKWRIAPFLILLYFVAFLDRVNISFAAQSMNRDLHINETLYGVGAGIFFIGYLLFAVPSNMLLKRLGARRWIATIMVSWGFISTFMAFLHGARTYVLCRFLLGLAEAGFFPGMIFYLTRWLPSSARAGLMALFVLAIPLSNVIGAPLSNWILTLGSAATLHGGQWLFLLEGVPAILLGLAVPKVLADGPEEVEWLTREEKWHLLFALDEGTGRDKAGAVKWTEMLRNRVVAGFCFQYFALMIGLYALGFWVPRILTSRGVSAALLGWMTAIPFALGAAAMLLCGHHSDRTGERKWHVIAAFLSAAIGMAVAAGSEHWGGAILGLILTAIGVFSAMPIFWATVTQSLNPGLAALAIATVNSFGNIGGFVGPLVVGSILQHTGSYRYGLLFTGGCLVAGALILAITSVPRTGAIKLAR